jgi:hypothetical protein
MRINTKLYCSIVCSFLTFGNTVFGAQFVVCKVGSDITIEIEHTSHCESAHSEDHHKHTDHFHDSEIEHRDDCAPCSDIQFFVEGNLPRNDQHNINLSSYYLPVINSLKKLPCYDTFLFSSLNRHSLGYTSYYPTITVLRI